jgi:hypothetical protein
MLTYILTGYILWLLYYSHLMDWRYNYILTYMQYSCLKFLSYLLRMMDVISIFQPFECVQYIRQNISRICLRRLITETWADELPLYL